MINWLRNTAPALLRPEGAVLAIGIIAFAVWLIVQTVSPPVVEVDVTRVEGQDRYATAAQLALEARPNGARSAILARGDDFADALAAGALVGPTDGVVLLTEADSVPEPTLDALETLNVGIVYLMGGSAAITDLVETDLAREYQVLRLAGANRFATAAAVARELDDREAVGVLEGRRTAFVVNGDTFPDAVAAASASAAGGYPILLTNTDQIPEETLQALDALEIGRVVVVGGAAAIGLPVTIELQQGGYIIEQISGADRAGTAAAVAERFVASTLVLDGDAAVLARGDEFPDALAASSYAGIIGAPLLLAPQPSDPGEATLEFLRERQAAGDLQRLIIIGGESAVSDEAVAQAHRAARGLEPPAPSPTPSIS